MDQVIRNAIARIDIVQDGESVERGTGTLVAPNLLLTAFHVVGERYENPPQPKVGTIKLTFPNHETEAVIIDGKCDAESDWALRPLVFRSQR